MVLPGRDNGLRRKHVSGLCAVLIVSLTLGTVAVLPGSAGAASHMRVPKPPKTQVSDLSASPSSLPATGGVLTLSATVSTATSCTFTGVTPRQGEPASGLPVTVPCSSGPVSITVSVPGNGCCTLLRYRFHLTVTGTRTKTKGVVVEIPPETVVDCSASGGMVDLEGCDFSNQDLQGFFAPYSDFTSANLTNTNLSSAELTGSNFYLVTASGAQFLYSDLTNADFAGATLTNANFGDANLTGAFFNTDLSTVVWGDTTCPDGTNSNADGGTCANHLMS